MENSTLISQKQQQKLFSFPLLRQAVHILQLPLMELREYIEQEIVNNPLLEELDTARTELSKAVDLDLEKEVKKLVNFELDLEEKDLEAYPAAQEEYLYEEEKEQRHRFRESLLTKPLSLQDELLQQLSLLNLPESEVLIAKELIGSLNENGFLEAGLEETAYRLASGDIQKVERVLSIIQGFEPYGVASRSISECLLLQLKAKGRENSLAAEVLKNHWEALTKKRYNQLAKILGYPPEEIKEAAAEIAKLNPCPAGSYGRQEAVKVVPDVILKKTTKGYAVLLKDAELPALRINSKYRKILQNKTASEQDKQFIKDKLKSALWLLQAIRQRNETLRKVSQCIADSQKEFLSKGPGRLKPLSIKEVARQAGVHPSTVSRVVAGKYLETPNGIIKLRDFFSNPIGSDIKQGKKQGAWSAEAVKSEIKGLVEKEGKARPLGDEEITTILLQRGLKITRRTVAKYRQKMGIFSSHIRREAQN